jgi:hypothetical protein
MVRRKHLWRLGFASAVFFYFFFAARCAAQDTPAVDIQHRLAFGWALLHDNSLYRERLPDWEACKDKFAGSVSVVDETTADEAMAKLVGSVHDDYTFFRNRAQTEKFRQNLEQRGVVSYHLGDDGVAYIRLRTFGSRYTAEEMRDTLRTLESADSYVLDLRGNRGGLVQQAFAVYSMFVDDGLFATFIGRSTGDDYVEMLSVSRTQLKRNFNGKVQTFARTANLTAHKPVAVLIDGDTRSASELLAGALHDSGRAVLVGTKTFGKGVVQDTWSLGDGSSVRITTGKSFLSKSGCIHGIGLQPDMAQLPNVNVIAKSHE